MAVYSAEAGKPAASEQAPKRGLKLTAALFQAMFQRLSPVRRVIFLLSLVLLVSPETRWRGDSGLVIQMQSAHIAAAGFVLLLALELADRVAMKRDLEIARDIQNMLLPEKPPEMPGVDIAFVTRPANTVAGDYYDAFLRRAPAGNNRLFLVVADVAGKGIPAGMLMATLEATVHALAVDVVPLSALVSKLNGCSVERSAGGRHFVTAFFGEYDPNSRGLAFVNAGHNPPMLVRAGGAVERLRDGGLPLGVLPGADYDEGLTTLEDGDSLYVFTDGVVEAVNGWGVEYGDERLEAHLQRSGDAPAAEQIRRLLASIDSFAAATPQSDDVTCLLMRVTAVAREAASAAGRA